MCRNQVKVADVRMMGTQNWKIIGGVGRRHLSVGKMLACKMALGR